MMRDYRDEFRGVEKEARWSLPRILLGILAMLLICYAIGFMATGGDLAIYRFWGPKVENAHRAVFEETQSYVDGKIQTISQLQLAYQSADGLQKEALRRQVVTESRTVNMDKLPIDLQLFVQQMKDGK